MATFHIDRRVLGGLTYLTAVTACAPPQASVVERHPATCTVTETGRTALALPDGAALYVEPVSFGARRGEVLMAGQPSLLFRFDDERARPVDDFDAFGAVLGDSPITALIPSPPVPHAGWSRGAQLDASGRWGFVIAQLDSVAGFAGPVVAVSYAEYGPEGWSAPEPLPVPGGGEMHVATGSRLIAPRDGWKSDASLAWAGLFVKETGGIDVLLYSRSNSGAWTVDTVVRDRADAVDLAVDARGVLALLVTGSDPSLGADRSSARVVVDVMDPRAGVLRLRDAPEGARLRTPRLILGPRGLEAAWLEVAASGGEAWWTAAEAPPVRIDESAELLEYVGQAGGATLWATLHVGDRSPQPRSLGPAAAQGRIRIHRVTAGGVSLVADLANPYHGPFRAHLSPTGEILLVGPEAHFDPTHPFVRSLVLRLSLSCDQVAAADHLPGR